MTRMESLVVILGLATVTSAQRVTAPLLDYLSRQDIKIPRLTVDSYNTSAVAPGYIFLTPFSPEIAADSEFGFSYQFGPAIYDNNGDLVWTGHNESYPNLGAVGFFACDYQGAPHLCYPHYDLGNQNEFDIVNSSYDLVRRVRPQGGELQADFHEFNLIEASSGATGKRTGSDSNLQTAIISSSFAKRLEPPVVLEHCNSTVVEWVKSSAFQEVKLDGSNEVLFEWHSIDHVPVQDVINCPAHAHDYGDGSVGSPFDYFHMNSVDKDSHGDYFVSGRHTSTISKISGKDGTVIYSLGLHQTGFKTSSDVPGVSFDFAYQHHIRLHPKYPGANLDAGLVAFSLFDNANDVYDLRDRTANISSGKIILVDENRRSATLKEAYTLYPIPGHELGTNQGSFQLLPNGNRIIGGGNIQEVIEWQPGNSEPVFRAHWGDWITADGSVGHKINSYRSLRFEWVGHPRSMPNVFGFAKDCESSTWLYASWNGATRVTSWTFWGGATEDGPFQRIAFTGRFGFESKVKGAFANYVYVVAHDGTFAEIGRSLPVRVAVPHGDRAQQCGEERCEPGFDYLLDAAEDCPPARLIDETGGPQATLGLEHGRDGEDHCDPCFPPTYQRFVA